MSIDAEVLNSETVDLLCGLYATEYTSESLARMRDPVPAMLNALGACAGFAAQVAVWRALVLPRGRNPGDYLVYVGKPNDICFYGEAINQFLFSTGLDRLSFLSLAAATLRSASDLVNIGELAEHVAKTVGTEDFGQPRVPPSIDLPELPRIALGRTWGKATRILQRNPPAEWPALLGAAAYNIVHSNRAILAPPIAIKILLEAAVPMSKLNPAEVEESGLPTPLFSGWSMRAARTDNTQEIITEVRGAMPAAPSRLSVRVVFRHPTIAFLNLSGISRAALVAEDSAQIGGLFHGNVRVVTTGVPICDVLFLYCDFDSSGGIVGAGLSLRDLIGKTGASVAVIASEVPSQFMSNPNFQKSWSRGSNPPANVVITSSRKGEAFGRFFKSLFQRMWTGVSMPMAWVLLAPQGRQQPQDIPVTICLMEAGQVVFRTSGSQTTVGRV
jgi:hypothetical protein